MLPELKGGVILNNGKVLEEKKINELTNYIINKFADEKLCMEEAEIILKNTNDAIREHSIVQKTTNV